MALVGVELETLVFEPDAQTTRPPLVRALLVSAVTALPNLDVAKITEYDEIAQQL